MRKSRRPCVRPAGNKGCFRGCRPARAARGVAYDGHHVFGNPHRLEAIVDCAAALRVRPCDQLLSKLVHDPDAGLLRLSDNLAPRDDGVLLRHRFDAVEDPPVHFHQAICDPALCLPPRTHSRSGEHLAHANGASHRQDLRIDGPVVALSNRWHLLSLGPKDEHAFAWMYGRAALSVSSAGRTSAASCRVVHGSLPPGADSSVAELPTEVRKRRWARRRR